MKIQTHHIPSRGLSLNYEKQTAEFAALKEMTAAGVCRFKSSLSVNLEVSPEKDYINVAGQLAVAVELVCSRCLEGFELPLIRHFELTYSQKIPKELHGDEAQGQELTAEQIGVIFYKGEEIDFCDAVQEQVVMALPFKALCKETCKGLCPHCGTDLNSKNCQCDSQPTAGPFDELKKLKLPSR